MNNLSEMPSLRVTLCLGSSCHSRGNRELTEALLQWKSENSSRVSLTLEGSLCLGRCSEGPLALLQDRVVKVPNEAALMTVLEDALTSPEAP